MIKYGSALFTMVDFYKIANLLLLDIVVFI